MARAVDDTAAAVDAETEARADPSSLKVCHSFRHFLRLAREDQCVASDAVRLSTSGQPVNVALETVRSI